MCSIIISDCGDPITDPSFQGYTFGTSTGTTYQSTHQITGCDAGYDGSASQTLTCEASGSWTTPTGCTIKGRPKLSIATVAIIFIHKSLPESTTEIIEAFRKRFRSPHVFLPSLILMNTLYILHRIHSGVRGQLCVLTIVVPKAKHTIANNIKYKLLYVKMNSTSLSHNKFNHVLFGVLCS